MKIMILKNFNVTTDFKKPCMKFEELHNFNNQSDNTLNKKLVQIILVLNVNLQNTEF